MKKEPIPMPVVSPVPFSTKGGYFGRVLRWLCYTRKWKFEEDWYFKLYNSDRIMISKGFHFDGASVPKPLRFLLSPTGVLFIPGIIHDYGYRFDKLIGTKIDENDKESLYNYHPGAGKVFWDGMFRRVGYQVCRLYIVTTIAYWAIALFGFNAWRKCRKLEVK